MKVCHLYPAVMLHDGPSNVLLAQLGELAARGIENVIVGLKRAPEERNPRKAIERAGGKYIELAMRPSMLDATVVPRLVRTLREEKPDILQCNLIRASLYGRLAARIAGRIPVISVAHNVEQYMTGGDAISRAVRFAERRTRAMVAAHVSVSEAVARVLAGVLGVNFEAIQVIVNGIGPAQNPLPHDESRELLGIPCDAMIVGTIGRLHAQKNHPLLLQAVARASTQIRNLRLVMIGEGEEGDNLRALAAELGITGLVHWMGRRNDIERIVSALDIFVMTSDYEGLPIALLEAMRAGIPSVVTRAGGMPEAVIDGETGYVVNRRDVKGVAEALVALASDAKLRNEMGRSAEVRFHSYYSTERMTVEYLKLYSQLSIPVSSKHKFRKAGETDHSCQL